MADSPFEVRMGALKSAALVLSLGLALLVLGTALALAFSAGGLGLRPADWAALRFTLLQAVLSALVSVGLAIPMARALARRRFDGRGALIALMGAPFLLPVVAAVVGMLAVYGRQGLVNRVLETLGLPGFSVFGLGGVVLAHVFFNLPLATRLLLNGWAAIPAERFRLAESLGLPPGAVFRHVEAPMLRSLVPGALLLVFLLCLTSFVVALTLGGGPRATTLELAIYQALRFDFDLGHAATLAGLHFALCALAVALAGRLAAPPVLGAGLDRVPLLAAPSGWRRWGDAVVLSGGTLFLCLPMGAVAWAGLGALGNLPGPVWAAALRSLVMALTSAVLATAAGLVLALAAARFPGGPLRRWIDLTAMLPLAASGMVLGTGLFLALRPLASPESLALPVTVLVNAAMALPFLYRLILPEACALEADYGRLCTTLGLAGLPRLSHVTLPRLARPLGLGAGIAAALAMGDLGVIALFAGPDTATLPLMVQRLAGAYRMDQAAAASLLLVALSFALFTLCDQGGRRAAA